jgi:hypothetical protein
MLSNLKKLQHLPSTIDIIEALKYYTLQETKIQLSFLANILFTKITNSHEDKIFKQKTGLMRSNTPSLTII